VTVLGYGREWNTFAHRTPSEAAQENCAFRSCHGRGTRTPHPDRPAVVRQMSETSSLTAALQAAHGQDSNDTDLRTRYAEYLPVKPAKGPGSGNPNRTKGPNEYQPELHEAEFEVAEANGDLLHGATRPPYILQQERPEHRFLVFLYAQGMGTKDIFIQLGGEWDKTRNAPVSGTGQYSYQHLHTIRRQAWFQTKLVQYMEECGKDVIRSKFEAELMPSIEKVIEIRDNSNAPVALQLRAAESLIDRFLGKPIQQVQALPVASVDRYEKDAADLVRETEAIEAELKNLNAAFLTNEE